MILGLAVLTLGVWFASPASAQPPRSDSTADALLRTADEESIDNEGIFDEIESLADDIRLRSQTRVIFDPSARDELGSLNDAFLGSSPATLEKLEGHSGPLGGGFAAQKDAWERSYLDDWAGYLELREPMDLGRVRVSRAKIGSYALRFGSGLIFGSGLATVTARISPASFGAVETPLRHSLSPHSLTALFGGAMDITHGDLAVVPFISRRLFDARLDTLGVQTVYTYLHRTSGEASFRNALGVNVGGMHLAYDDSTLRFGSTIVRTAYDKPLNTTSSHTITGTTLDNLGLDAGVHFEHIDIAAEAALARSSALTGKALIGSVAIRPSSRLRLSAIYHRQDTNYFAPFAATAVNGSGDITNEEGYWLGFAARIMNNVDLSGAIDMSHPLASLSANVATPAFDDFLDAHYASESSIDLDVRYRHRDQSALARVEENGIQVLRTNDHTQSNLRFIGRYGLSTLFTVGVRSEGTAVANDLNDDVKRGAFLQANFEYLSESTRASIMIARFSTDSYDSRLYTYASEVTGIGSILLLNGNGWLSGLQLDQHILPWLSVEAYAGGYFYDHERSFGSGLTARTGAMDITCVLQLTAQP